MIPLPADYNQTTRLWNTIYVADVLDAINPFTCIRCLHRKSKPGVNTICASCQLSLNADTNRAEHFLFYTCIRIFAFFIWVRRKTLSDIFILKDHEDGTLIQHHIGLPGDKQNLPSLRAVRKPDNEHGEDGQIELLSPMGQELQEQVLLTSRQCDNVLVLLADIMERELLQASSPVLKIDEILYKANHEHTSSHWCYRVTLHDQRQFAVAFADKQLGWPHIVRDWKEYVLERFEEWDERDALFYMKNPCEHDSDEEPDEGEKRKLPCWKERGVSVRGIGGVLEAHRSHWWPRPDELPPYNMIIGSRPEDWRPEQGLSVGDIEIRQKNFGCWLEADNGGVEALWKMWRESTKEGESRIRKVSAAPLSDAKGIKRKIGDLESLPTSQIESFWRTEKDAKAKCDQPGARNAHGCCV